MADLALPNEVKWTDVVTALRSLGIEVEGTGLMSVYFDPQSITTVHKRLDEAGNAVAAGNEIATVTTKIGVRRG